MDNNQGSIYNFGKLYPERLLEMEHEFPDFACCIFLNHMGEIESQLTIREWIAKSRTAAAALQELGVEEGDRVIVALPTSEEFLLIFLGLWWIGAIPVPLINPMPGVRKEGFRDRFVHMISDCYPKGAVFQDAREDLILEVREGARQPDFPQVKVWSCQQLLCSGAEKKTPISTSPFAHRKESIAFIQYTSGSTGNPKGVTVTHGSLLANLQAIAEASELVIPEQSDKETDSCLSWMPFYHDMGLIGGLLFNSYYRIPLYLLSPISFLMRPSVWLESISKYKISLSTGNNFAYHLCARRIRPDKILDFDLSSWRLAYNGSESVNADTLALFHKKFSPYGFRSTAFYPVYGMAEATLAITFPKPGKKPHIDYVDRIQLIEKGEAIPVNASAENAFALVANGSCLPGHQLVIKEPKGDQVLGERKIGEICFSGPSVTPGYYERNKIIAACGGELRTGDLGYLADNLLYAVDRLKDLIQIAGSNYYPSDIEKEIQRVPETKPGRTIAFDVPNPDQGTNDLIIVTAVNATVDATAVKKEIRNQVYTAFGLVPKDIAFVDKKAIPITSSGKIRRRECRNLYLENKLDRHFKS